MKKSFKSRLKFEFYVFIDSVVKIFSSITKDIIDSILNMNKKYHWLVGTFLFMLINSITPLYYLFIGDINKIIKEGSYNTETTDFVTYYTSFRVSVYIFITTIIIFIIRQYININRQLRNNKNKDHSM